MLWKLSGCVGSRNRADRCPATLKARFAPRNKGPAASMAPSPVDSDATDASATPLHRAAGAAAERTSTTAPDLKPNSGGMYPVDTVTDSSVIGSGATPNRPSNRSYHGTPSTTYSTPSSTPRTCRRPLSSLPHPGTVASTSWSPRVRIRGEASRSVSPPSVTRVLVEPDSASADGRTSTCSAATADIRRFTVTGRAAPTCRSRTSARNGDASARIE